MAQHRTLTWIARSHSHSDINTVTTTLCVAPAQLLHNLESIFYFEGTATMKQGQVYCFKTASGQYTTLLHNPSAYCFQTIANLQHYCHNSKNLLFLYLAYTHLYCTITELSIYPLLHNHRTIYILIR